MTHTLFYDDNTMVVPKRVAAYDPGPKGNFPVDWSTTYDIVGGGGLMSTVDDLLAWDRKLLYQQARQGNVTRQVAKSRRPQQWQPNRLRPGSVAGRLPRRPQNR